MNGNYKTISLVLLLTLSAVALGACGNKGELYLEPIDLSEEQRELLNEIEGKKPKAKKNNTGSVTPSDISETIDSIERLNETQ